MCNNGNLKRIKRDLHWVFNSSDLLHLPEYGLGSWLEQVQSYITKQSIDFEQPSNYRLGIYFEQLVVQALEQSKAFNSIEANQQVIINKHTLGEFDVLLQTGTDEDIAWTHLELATKFYLKIGNGNKLSDWVGPNLRDRFDDKFNRLIQHQLTLSSHEQVAEWLEKRDIVITDTSLLCKGRLFYPWQEFIEQEFDFPQPVSAEHLKGFWITMQELQQKLESGCSDWYVLPKNYWLAAIESDDLDELVELNSDNYQELCEPRLVQIAQCQNGIEVARGFVVTEGWLVDANLRIKS